MLDDQTAEFFGAQFEFPGVRLTLWLAGLIIIGAGFISRHSLRSAAREEAERAVIDLRDGAEVLDPATGTPMVGTEG